MTATESNNRTANGAAELHGPPPESTFYWYPARDWIALCEDLRDRDRTVYGVLRSLVIEDRRRGFTQDVRKLSLDTLCALIPGVNGKPTGLGGLRDSLRRLGRVGLVSDPDGNPLTTSSSPKAAARDLRIRIHDTPCNGYVPQWTNTEQKLAALRSGCDGNQVGCDGNQVGCNRNQVGCNRNQAGCDGNQGGAPEQPGRDLYTPPSHRDSSHPSPTGPDESASGTTGVGVEDEEEGGENLANDTDTSAVSEMIARLPGRLSRPKRDRLTVQAAPLVAAGWGLGALERELADDLGGVRSHYAVYQKRLSELTKVAPAADDESAAEVSAPAPRIDIELVDLRQDAAEAARDIAAPGSSTLGRIDFWIKGASKPELAAFIAAPSPSVLEADEAAAPSRATQIHAESAALADSLSIA